MSVTNRKYDVDRHGSEEWGQLLGSQCMDTYIRNNGRKLTKCALPQL